MEIYKKIDGFNYEISNYGNVRSIDKVIKRKDGKALFVSGKLLKKKISKFGYIRYTLCENGKQSFFLAHRLVAEYFLQNPNSESQVNHKDEDKSNNHFSNLEWCSRVYNLNYGSRNKTISEKLNKKVLSTINGCVNHHNSINEASFSTGYSTSYISMCCNNIRSSKKVSFKFI